MLDFVYEAYVATEIVMNEHFDFVYGCVYAFILLPLFVAVVLQFVYWCSADSHGARSVVPWSFLIGGIVNVLLIIWIITYIVGIYSEEKVYMVSY